MRANQFDRPVFMKRRFFIQEVGCLDDVFDVLEEWPEDERDVAHEAMMRACNRAAAGVFPISAIRDNFERFLKRQGKLAQAVPDEHPSLRRTA
jgi:hypothetical protein